MKHTKFTKDTKHAFSRTTRILHWGVGIIMVALLGMGTYMAENKVYFLYPIHKSVGTLILILVAWRVIWRLKNGFPTPVRDFPNWQRIASRLSHYLLLLGTLIMPVSGILGSVSGGRGLYVFGLELVARNRDAITGKIVAHSEAVAGFAHNLHFYTGRILIALVVIHILAAVKHHFIDRDDTLRRMLGRNR